MQTTTIANKVTDVEYIEFKDCPTYGIFVDSGEHGSTAPPLKVVVIMMLITFPAL